MVVLQKNTGQSSRKSLRNIEVDSNALTHDSLTPAYEEVSYNKNYLRSSSKRPGFFCSYVTGVRVNISVLKIVWKSPCFFLRGV